jgi:two-component system NtrC family response regulator
MPQVLIIDDDPAVCQLLAAVTDKAGHETVRAHTAKEGLQALGKNRIGVVLLDVVLPDGNGLKLLPQIREISNAPEVIIITGNGDPDAAELAIKNGAWDYLIKPPKVENIILAVNRAMAYRFEKSASRQPKVLKREDVIGNSAGLNALLERVAQAASVESNILITGETGTGKELVARVVHANSTRADQRFVVVDCAALPETLMESVLFGHVKGAFTGAEKEHEGLIRQAHGGTLFLDEIGELPLSAQKAFLRVIQERCFRQVSGRQEIQVNFRLIAATHRDLDAMATNGTFRKDLLFRLRSVCLEVPPLRRRKEDIKPLAVHHIHRLCDIYGAEVKGFSGDFIQALEQYKWPGNVRELLNSLEEALSVARGEPMLYPHHLPTRIRAILTRMMVKAHAPNPAAISTI